MNANMEIDVMNVKTQIIIHNMGVKIHFKRKPVTKVATIVVILVKIA